MDFKEFQEFYNANRDNAELKNFMSGEFQNYANSDDGVKFLQPILDSHSSKVVDSFKKKGMEKEFEKRLETEIEKVKLELNPPKNPLEQKLAELEAKLNKTENEKIILGVKEKAMKALKYPELESLLNVSADEEATLSNVNTINENIGTIIDRAVEAKLKGAARVPGGNSGNKPQGFYTQEQVANMSSDEISANYEKVKESQKHW